MTRPEGRRRRRRRGGLKLNVLPRPEPMLKILNIITEQLEEDGEGDDDDDEDSLFLSPHDRPGALSIVHYARSRSCNFNDLPLFPFHGRPAVDVRRTDPTKDEGRLVGP
jgi:hypothetical protein